MAHLGSREIIRNEDSRKNIVTGDTFSNNCFQGNLREPILLHVFLLDAFFSATNYQKSWLGQVPLEITVRNKVFSVHIFARNVFVTVIYMGTYFFARVSTRSLFIYQLILKNMVALGSLGIRC
jgi:hypothetical protein